MIWCLHYNIWTRFYLLYVLEESEVVAWKSFIKKVFLKVPRNLQENICAGVSFAIKLQAGKPTTSLHAESSTAAFFKNICFVNVCEGLPLKSKIFTGVSFRKILAFYYKRNRQLFYYEGNSPYVPLKIPECVNRVISQNFSELLLLKMPQQTKTCSKSTTKECFRYVISVSL